jgi:hypothetical protein
MYIGEDSLAALPHDSTTTRDLPTWVVTAASDIDRLTVQQQFQPAVQIILSIRKYRQGVDSNFQKLLTIMTMTMMMLMLGTDS